MIMQSPEGKKLAATYRLRRLIRAWNAATDPSIPRTDREHRSNRRVAMVAMAMLRKDFKECEDFKQRYYSAALYIPADR